jgi:hypothetical protein
VLDIGASGVASEAGSTNATTSASSNETILGANGVAEGGHDVEKVVQVTNGGVAVVVGLQFVLACRVELREVRTNEARAARTDGRVGAQVGERTGNVRGRVRRGVVLTRRRGSPPT